MKTQIWIAISVYVLVAIVKKRLGVAASLYTILQILSLTLFEKTPLDQLLNDAARKRGKSRGSQAVVQRCLTIAGKYGTSGWFGTARREPR